MDTIKIFLIATVTLLLGALGVTILDVRKAPEQASQDELARLRRQIEDLRVEQRVQAEQHKVQSEQAAPKEDVNVSALRAKLDEKEAALKALEDQKARAEKEAKVSKEEAGVIAQRDMESRDQSARRARMISQALLIARIKEYVEDANVGSFATLEVLMPENLKVGDELAIRRHTGILGKFKVSEVNPDGAIANPVQEFGATKPQKGDELIVPLQD